MHFSYAAARSRYKWILCCLVIIILFYIHNHSSRQSNDSSLGARGNFKASSAPLFTEAVEPTSTAAYFVKSESCKIPYIDPFAAEALAIYSPWAFEKCSNESDLVTSIFDMNRKRYILHINDSVAAQALNSRDIEFNCFYREIVRVTIGDTFD